MRRVAAETRNQKSSNLTDAKKYLPGLDPLEKESSIDNIQPLGKVEADRMMKLINRLLSRGGLSQEEKNAFNFWKANLVVENAQGIIHQEFMRDFWAWLLGRGKESDHKKSPWYRQSLCNDPEVSAYVDSFVTKRHEFQIKLKLLSMRHPQGINQHYLYFKYVIRGEPANSDHFLDDWGLFVDEVKEARALGQRERNFDEIGEVYQGENAFHEMAPYGSQRKLVGQTSHDRKAEKMVQNAAKSWANDDLSDEEGEKDKPKQKIEIVDDKPTNSTELLKEDSASEEDLPDLEDMTELEKNGNISLEQKAETAKKFQEEAGKQILMLEEKIKKQEEEINSLKLAKQPTENELALVGQMQENREMMSRISSQSLEMQKQFLSEIQENRNARSKEAADLREFLKNLKSAEAVSAVPIEGSKPIVEDVTEPKTPAEIVVSPGFHQKFDEFLDRFARYASQTDARMREIEDNLMNKSGETGPMIEELDALTGEFRSIAESLKDIPQKLLAIEASSQAEREAAKSHALALVADNNKNAKDIVAAIESSAKIDKAFLESLLKGFDGGFRNMMNMIQSNDVTGALAQQSKMIGEIIAKIPAANSQLLLEWSKQMQVMTENRIVLHEQTKNIPSAQMTNALKAMETVANQQAQMIAQFQATAQRQLQQEATLREAQQAFQKLRSEKDQQVKFLAQRVDQSQQHARYLENQARQSIQRAADLERQVNYLGNLNQVQYQAYLQQRAQQENLFNAWRRAAEDYANRIASEYPTIENGEQLLPMEIDEEKESSFTEEEKWLLRISGPAPPLLLTGAQKKGILPEYSADELGKLDEKTRKLFDSVSSLEKMLIENAKKYGKELGPEMLHVFGVKSLKPALLKNKIERYQQLLREWGVQA